MADDVEVLIVGAGPTGLAHALWLTRAGVRVRIIDRQAEPGTMSRAVGVAALAGVDNFAPLARRAWQLHVHGDASDALRSAGLPLHVFPWAEAAEDAGVARDAAYLIRPDGYIGWAGDDADELAGYRARVGV